MFCLSASMKNEVEGFCAFGVEFGERVQGGAEAEFDEGGESGALDVGESDFGVFGFDFEGDEFSVGGECAGEPCGAVAAEGSDFEDAAGRLHSREEVEEFALVGGYVDGGQAGGFVGFECGVEGRVGRDEVFDEILVDGCPEFLSHKGRVVSHNSLRNLNMGLGRETEFTREDYNFEAL